MEAISIQKVKEQIKVNMFLLDCDREKKFTFSPLVSVETKNERINFSLLISIKQKSKLNFSLNVELIKLAEGGTAERNLHLTKVPLEGVEEDPEEDYYDSVYFSENRITANWDSYGIEGIVKLDFLDVPVIGSGKYAIIIGAEHEDSIAVFDTQYFDVKVDLEK